MNFVLGIKLCVSGIFALILLTSCAASPPAPEPLATNKEAGMLGTRICFTNDSNKTISAGPMGTPNTEKSKPAVGSAGVLTSADPLCFAGWNSTTFPQWNFKDGRYILKSFIEDVVVGINSDGNYNILLFKGSNIFLLAPRLHWTDRPQEKDDWAGGGMSEGEEVIGNVAGLSFVATRVNDSELYKEFTVRFQN